MPTYDPYSQPISFEYLSQFKALEPLPADAIAALKKIEKIDVANFNEAEVRSFVIDPIVKVLGYDKGTDFSVDLGRRIEFLDKNKFPDYRFHLWQENFWIIEAKRPRLGGAAFGYEDLAQAVEYAVHPEINAALVVLCDGLKIEIFDREVSLTKPVLHIDKANLIKEFDNLILGVFSNRCRSGSSKNAASCASSTRFSTKNSTFSASRNSAPLSKGV
jgi:hypothetical protein